MPYPLRYSTLKINAISCWEPLAVPQLFLAVPLGVSVSAALQQLMRCAASEASESLGTRLQGIGGFCMTGHTEELWSHHRAHY